MPIVHKIIQKFAKKEKQPRKLIKPAEPVVFLERLSLRELDCEITPPVEFQRSSPVSVHELKTSVRQGLNMLCPRSRRDLPGHSVGAGLDNLACRQRHSDQKVDQCFLVESNTLL